jgi:hypothetical protein
MNLNTKINRMARVKKVEGDVGIEIECEVRKQLTKSWDSRFWTLHSDGSLRNIGYEFVLSRPIKTREIDPALNDWLNNVQYHQLKFVDSKRASVHVHCNVQDYTILEVFNVLASYWLVEPLLLEIAGNERKGNLFCLGINSADTVHSQLITNLKKGQFFQNFSKDSFRYASINLEALYKFGSLEFRIMRGTQDTQLIAKWAKELRSLVDNAKKFKSPHEIIHLVSEGKHKRFLRSLFSEEFVDDLIKATGHSWRNKINENVLLILDILAAKDHWDPAKDEEEEKKRAKEQPHEDLQLDIMPQWDNGEPMFEWGRHGFPVVAGEEVGRMRSDGRAVSGFSYWNGLEWQNMNRNDAAQGRQYADTSGSGIQLFFPRARVHSRVVIHMLNRGPEVQLPREETPGLDALAREFEEARTQALRDIDARAFNVGTLAPGTVVNVQRPATEPARVTGWQFADELATVLNPPRAFRPMTFGTLTQEEEQ